MKTIHLVAGARPNFMKLAPLVRALDRHSATLNYRIVHTGQHYDREMSDVFFEELGIPKPDFNLDAGGGTHAQQTAKVMVAFETLCLNERPDAVLVVGDVNSTLACTIVAKKLGIPVAHVEAGLRSGDLTMPEEINRLVTDAIADWFFVTEPSGRDNLFAEGKPASAVHYVGHVMVDNLFFQLDKLTSLPPLLVESSAYKRAHARYGVVTLHRPSNVDDPATLQRIAAALRTISDQLPLVFPVHPRTRGNLERFEIDLGPNVSLLPPLAYMEFLNLWKDAVVVLTDSGGMQEETTALGIPCLTLRDNTERPVTLTEGTNTLVGTDTAVIVAAAQRALGGETKQGRRPALWDGHAAERIADVLAACLGSRACN
jgi:UDP-N-acetylglucosamine 2-epimerase (non-hydrolysing)